MKGLRWWVALLMLVAAIAVEYRLPRQELPALHPPLARLPMQVGDWVGEGIAIDPHLVAVSHVDEYLNRLYRPQSAQAGGEVGLYVGYYGSQRAGDSVHSPKNCLPGSGWQPLSSAVIALPLRAGEPPVPVNAYVVENEGQRYVVLYWYQSHGRVIASEYRAKLYTIRDAIALHRTDSALVRITVPIVNDEAESRRTAVSFAQMVAPDLDSVLPGRP